MSTESKNPFKVGERVTFQPYERAIGWSYSSFDRFRLQPGDSGTISRIQDDQYLFLDDERGGFHWQCYRAAE